MNYLLITNFFINDVSLVEDFTAHLLVSGFFTEPDWQKIIPNKNKVLEFKNNGSFLIYPKTKKETLSQDLIAYFIKYQSPTYLYLGNLDEFSLPMQEGLLRFIEEPPQNLNIILTVRSKNQILETINSRCRTLFVPQGFSKNYLETEFTDQVKNSLPDPKNILNDVLKGKKPSIPDLKGVSRESMDFWLWQLEYYLSHAFLKNPENKIIRSLLQNILEAKKLNAANVLNRLVWAQIFSYIEPVLNLFPF